MKEQNRGYGGILNNILSRMIWHKNNSVEYNNTLDVIKYYKSLFWPQNVNHRVQNGNILIRYDNWNI